MAIELPPQDQPDTYNGIRNAVRIQAIHIDGTDLSNPIAHLCVTPHQGRAYCGDLTRGNAYYITGWHYRNDIGARLKVDNRGIILRTLIEAIPQWTFNRRPLTLCPLCHTMLACEAEMIGSRDYKIKGTIKEMDKLPPR
ncbi:hypothetical protein F8390_06835 [Corynebacterium sp. 366]|uniref:hypothetical protein n=1 Tax=Corynebacterium sp. 366 TaxID=2652251 RepID=UPI00125CC9DF|nr:hypothetical protein [Corynebacterium sp. 366]KAB3538727.1 hypothetical protein F8390_06835 [Corynebacterium sp. 366]